MNLFNFTSLQIGSTIFLDPIFLYIGIATFWIPFFCLLFLQKKQALPIHFLEDLKKSGFHTSYIFHIKMIFLSIAYLLFFIIFANPHALNIKEKIVKDGIDIVIALDVSKSMEANDLHPSRIHAAQEVISAFIHEIGSDRLGLVVFAGKPYTSVPLSYDYSLVSQIVNELTTDSLNQNISGLDGTAIGDALLLSAKILENNQSKKILREKVIILLTDGDANRGVDPILAAKSLKSDTLKIYTIGVGSKQGGDIEIKNGPFTQKQKIPPLNEVKLREISSLSNAAFFRATDNDSLEQIFLEITKLETTEIETEIEKHHIPDYNSFIIILLSCLGIVFWIHFFYKQ